MMEPAPPTCLEIFLNPGEHFFGDSETRIRTLLGSCIATTMWHPHRRIGGMCHFLIPERKAERIDTLDGRYGTEALLMLIRDAVAADSDPCEYQYKVFGGGNMFPEPGERMSQDIGVKNVRFVERFLSVLGHEIETQHVGGYGHRNVVFDVWSGAVWMRHQRIERMKVVAYG